MKGKIICIVIALMVLSISAILVANPNILYAFEIRHHESLSAAEQAARLLEGD